MCLQPNEEIDNEVHPTIDQFFRIEEGNVRFVFNDREEHLVGDGDAVVVPAGTFHNVINTSSKNRSGYTRFTLLRIIPMAQCIRRKPKLMLLKLQNITKKYEWFEATGDGAVPW